ncbi:MAG: hypothetical protein ACRYGP_01545, partial [Janthinobacterium lividum]
MVEGISGRDFSDAEPLERRDDEERTSARDRAAPRSLRPETEARAPAPAAEAAPAPVALAPTPAIAP